MYWGKSHCRGYVDRTSAPASFGRYWDVHIPVVVPVEGLQLLADLGLLSCGHIGDAEGGLLARCSLSVCRLERRGGRVDDRIWYVRPARRVGSLRAGYFDHAEVVHRQF